MTDTPIEDLLQKIENELQDNLDGVVQLSPKSFSTEALKALRKEWERRYQSFHHKMKWCNALGYIAMVSFIISLILFFVGYLILSKLFLGLFGAALVGTITGYSILFKKYGAGIKQQYVQKAIDAELAKRTKLEEKEL